MPRSEDPTVPPPGTSVSVIYPGSSPADLESLVVDPIEGALNELEDIKTVESYASHGFAIINIEFIAGLDDEEKYSDVVQKVNTIRGDLPEDIQSLETIKWSTSAVAILQIALVSDTAVYSDFEYEAKRLKKILEKVPGVKEVDTMGYPEREVRISVDLEKTAHMRIPLSVIADAVVMNNTNICLGPF